MVSARPRTPDGRAAPEPPSHAAVAATGVAAAFTSVPMRAVAAATATSPHRPWRLQ